MAKPLPAFVAHVLDLLAPLGAVRARAMFGGWGIYCEDRMVALIAYDELYFKADGQTQRRFADAGSSPFVYAGKGKPVQMSYWRCPEAAMDEPEAFLGFARLALEAAARAEPARKCQRNMAS